MANEIKALNDAINLVNKLETEVQGLESRILSLSEASLKAGKNFSSIKSPRDLTSQIEQSQSVINKLTNSYREHQNTISELKKQVDLLKKPSISRVINRLNINMYFKNLYLYVLLREFSFIKLYK